MKLHGWGQKPSSQVRMAEQKDGKRGWPRGQVVKFTRSAAGGPVFCWFESWVRTWHCSSNHAEAASHMPQLEGPTTKNIQLCTEGALGRKRKKIKSLKKKKKERWKDIEDHGSPAHFISFFWFLRGTPCQFCIFLVSTSPCWLPQGGLPSQANQSEYPLHQPKCLVQGGADRVLRLFPGNDMWPLLGLLKSEDTGLGILGDHLAPCGEALN